MSLLLTMDRLASLFASPIKPVQAKAEDVKTRYVKNGPHHLE